MKIKILKIEPGKKPEIKEIEDGLKSLQDEVQGDIEAVYPFDDNVGIICNEEGKINGMAMNRALYDDDGEMYDIIAGPFLVVGLTEKEMYPVGTRIELIQMGDDPQPVPPGTRGTVAYVDDMGQIGMHWDNGRGLSLIPGEDSFRKLTEQEIADEQKAASFETVGPTLS